MPAVDVAAVGTSTTAAIEARGGREVASGRSGMADLLDLVSDRLTSSRVVFPHSTNSNPVALQTLRVRTMGRLEEFDVYQTTSVAPESTPVEAVVFASPSAVEGWLLSRDFDGLVVGAIGPTTRSSVSEIRQPDVVAPRPTHAALATVMASFLEVSV
jgi:uroporphyrinogen-III synthase